MSVRIMSMVYAAHFHDITFTHKSKKKATGVEYEKSVKVMNFNLKSVCVALADHANDEGEGAYPSVETISDKTEISDVTVIACLKALKQVGIIQYVGRSKWDTCNYTIKKDKLIEMAGWERQKREKVKSKAALVSEVKPLYPTGKAALPESSLNHPKPHEEEEAKNLAEKLAAEEAEKLTQNALAQISKAYESEIGVLTAYIADELKDAADTYPMKWVLDAIRTSATNNKRNWNYTLAILKRWQAQGSQDDARPQSNRKDTYAKSKGIIQQAVEQAYTAADRLIAEQIKAERGLS